MFKVGRLTIGNLHGRVGIAVRTADQFAVVNFQSVGSVTLNRPCCSPIVEWFNMDGEGSPSLPKARGGSGKNASDAARHSYRSKRTGRSWVLPCQYSPTSLDLRKPTQDNRVQAVHSWRVELAERIVRPLGSMTWKLAERWQDSRSSGN